MLSQRGDLRSEMVWSGWGGATEPNSRVEPKGQKVSEGNGVTDWFYGNRARQFHLNRRIAAGIC